MNMKYFQALADIQRHCDDILMHYENTRFGHRLLETWGVKLEDIEEIKEEREALRFLLDCQLMVARKVNSQKPSIDVVNRCFNRHLAFLEKIHHCHAYNVNQHRNPLVKKQYKACRHYLFKFSLPAWYAKLPEEILSFENKYPDFEAKRSVHLYE